MALPIKLPKFKLPKSISFWLFFALPLLLGASYIFIFGSPRYEAITHFTIEQNKKNKSGGVSSISGLSASPASIRDGLIVKDFIESRGVIEQTKEDFDIRKVYARSDKDFIFRLSQNASIEDIVEYWRDHVVTVDFDLSSGVVALSVLAFEREDALQVTQAILRASDKLVNTLSEKARQDTLEFARSELANAEERLKKARFQTQQFKDKEKTILSPQQTLERNRQRRLDIISTLEGQVASAEANLRSLKQTLSPSVARVRNAQNQVDSLKTQIRVERKKLDDLNNSGSNKSVAATLTYFEELQTDQNFAEKLYLSALSSLEQARADASKKHRYLTVTVEPRLPEEAAVPRQPQDTFILLFACLLIWGIGSLIVASIKDHAGWV